MNTTAAFFLIVIISVAVGFWLTREEIPIADSTEYGIDAFKQLKTLDDGLSEE